MLTFIIIATKMEAQKPIKFADFGVYSAMQFSKYMWESIFMAETLISMH